ncbi:hypothetical protein EJA05_22680 [Pseudomonas oryziphila]|uniref:Uncharacterized protein n=1 Tax=Pseudomonas entomophila TaxID=312306 RepID=A0A3S8UPP7_9PSED|nr:hypothetical protein EJA05_22680 [Pseudomonas oryziphila]
MSRLGREAAPVFSNATKIAGAAAQPFPTGPAPRQGRSYSCRAIHVGAGLPAKQATRRMAPALPVFAGKPAPTNQCAEVSQ